MSKQIVENYLMHIECDMANGDLKKEEAKELANGIMKVLAKAMVKESMDRILDTIDCETCPRRDTCRLLR